MRKSSIAFVLAILIILSGCIFRKQETVVPITDNDYTSATKKEYSPWLDVFSIGALHDGMDCGKNYFVMEKLGFNIWQVFARQRL